MNDEDDGNADPRKWEPVMDDRPRPHSDPANPWGDIKITGVFDGLASPPSHFPPCHNCLGQGLLPKYGEPEYLFIAIFAQQPVVVCPCCSGFGVAQDFAK
ncbi:MAG TPA: hypothetical protein VI756_00050 [Blastocatellia bacterium]